MKRILFIMFFIPLHGMNKYHNNLDEIAPREKIIQGAAYYIIHHAQKGRNCWRHAEPHFLKIKSKACVGHSDPRLKSYFAQPAPVIIFYDQDKQRLSDILILPNKKKKLPEIAEKMLDPNTRPRAITGSMLRNSLPVILQLFDKDNELLMSFFGCEGTLPLSEEERRDIAQFVDVSQLMDDRVQYAQEKKSKKKEGMWSDLVKHK